MKKTHHLRNAFFIVSLVCGLTSEPSYAYLDPGTGSIVVQGLLAAIVGAMVTVRLYWTRIKSFFTGEAPSAAKDAGPSGDASASAGENDAR